MGALPKSSAKKPMQNIPFLNLKKAPNQGAFGGFTCTNPSAGIWYVKAHAPYPRRVCPNIRHTAA